MFDINLNFDQSSRKVEDTGLDSKSLGLGFCDSGCSWISKIKKRPAQTNAPGYLHLLPL